MDVFINSGLFQHFWLLLHKKRTAPPFKRERSIIPPFLVLGAIYKILCVGTICWVWPQKSQHQTQKRYKKYRKSVKKKKKLAA